MDCWDPNLPVEGTKIAIDSRLSSIHFRESGKGFFLKFVRLTHSNKELLTYLLT